MSAHIAALIERIKALEAELDVENWPNAAPNSASASSMAGSSSNRSCYAGTANCRSKLSTYLLNARPLVILTTLIIYSLIVPFVLLDLFVMLYQATCFPAYGSPRSGAPTISSSTGRVSPISMPLRSSIAPIARMRTGVIAYVREVASRTEEYWCPIKHPRRVMGTHARYAGFEDYGDADAYRSQLERHRASLKKEDGPRP